MPFSYNGWFASTDLSTRDLSAGGVAIVPGILSDDDVYTVLHYVAQQFHERVENLVSGWCWGYNYRTTTNDPSRSLSNHSSGTAIDLNAPKHPYGVLASHTFSQAQIDEIHKILSEVGCVAWGGDYHTNQDGMHFDISGTKAEVAAAAARIRNGMEDVMQDADFARIRGIVQEELAPIKGDTSHIEQQLEAARKRAVLANKQLREVRDGLASDSPIRVKLNKIIDLVDG